MFFLLIYDFDALKHSNIILTHCIPSATDNLVNKKNTSEKSLVENNETNELKEEDLNETTKVEQRFFDDPLYINHPLTRSYFNIKNILRSKRDNVEPYPEIEVEDIIPPEVLKVAVKKDICDMLKNYQLRRTDFFVSNFIAWFKEKYKTIEENILVDKKPIEDKVKIEAFFNDLIKNDIVNQLLPSVRQILNLKEDPLLNLNKNFKIYCDPKDVEEIPDVALLLGGTKGKSVKLIPSLIVMLFMEDESELLDNLLDIILNSYMQREIFINALSEIELLNIESEIDLYYKMRKVHDEFAAEVSRLEYSVNSDLDDHEL